MLSTENKVESKAFDVMVQIRDWDLAQGTHTYSDLGGEAHSPDEDCSNVEAGSDYTETIRRFRAKPRKNFVDDQAASPSSWKTPRMAVWMAA